MTKNRPPLLLTRSPEASARFSALFRRRFGQDWRVVEAPVMKTVYQSPSMPEGEFDGIIFTSENAIRGVSELNETRQLKAFCVGPRTTEVASRLGYRTISGPGDAVGLAPLIKKSGAKRLLYPRGVNVAQDMAKLLESGQIETCSLVVYAQHPCDLTAEAMALLLDGRPVLLPLFSPQSVRYFARAAGTTTARLLIAALSATVAMAARDLEHDALCVAAQPNSDAMLEALADLVNRPALG